jgi:hypothetical protein
MLVKKYDVVGSIFHSFFKFQFDEKSNRDNYLVRTIEKMADGSGLTLTISLPEASKSVRNLIVEVNSTKETEYVNTFVHLNEIKEITKTPAA